MEHPQFYMEFEQFLPFSDLLSGTSVWRGWNLGTSELAFLVAPNDLPESSAKVWSAAWGLRDWDRKLDSQRLAQELGTTWNHLEPCFHFVSFVSFISLAYHSPSRHCPRLIAPGFCDPLGRWWWCCALWKLSKSRKNMFIYMCICVYVVINNRHRYIAWQYVVCKGTAHIGTCVPTYIQTYDCVCVCAYTNSYRCKHIYM